MLLFVFFSGASYDWFYLLYTMKERYKKQGMSLNGKEKKIQYFYFIEKFYGFKIFFVALKFSVSVTPLLQFKFM